MSWDFDTTLGLQQGPYRMKCDKTTLFQHLKASSTKGLPWRRRIRNLASCLRKQRRKMDDAGGRGIFGRRSRCRCSVIWKEKSIEPPCLPCPSLPLVRKRACQGRQVQTWAVFAAMLVAKTDGGGVRAGSCKLSQAELPNPILSPWYLELLNSDWVS